MADGTWIGVVLSLIAMMGAAIAGLFTWLQSRDKLKFDAKMAAMDQKLTDCEAKHEECEEKHALLRTDVNAIRQQLEDKHG
jgi:FtsZ-interacting cell division protein ZipA